MKKVFSTIIWCLLVSFLYGQCTIKMLGCSSLEATINETSVNKNNRSGNSGLYSYTLEQELFEGVWKSIVKRQTDSKKIVFMSLKDNTAYRVTCVPERKTKNSVRTRLSTYQSEVKKAADGFVSNTIYLNCGNQETNKLSNTLQKKRKSEIKIFPNPVADFLMVSNLSGEHNKLNFFDLQGNLILTTTTDSSTTKVDITPFPKGIYFLKIVQDKEVMSNHKIIIL